MIAAELISGKLFPLKKSDSIKIAMEIMNEQNIAMLPVIDQGKHMGYVGTSDIMDVTPQSKSISHYINAQLVSKVFAGMHLFEVIKVFGECNSSTLSVVDEEDNFVGIIAAKELIRKIAEMNSFFEQGSIVILQMGLNDYTLSEISRICEHNDNKILSLFISGPDANRNIQVHIKLSGTEIKSLIATFERFNYTVFASYQSEEDVLGLKFRYDHLMKYLDL
jgi:predicted transcriptional regulator